MMTKAELAQLQNDCSGAVYDLDARVEVEQDEEGRLSFTLFNEDEEPESFVWATPYGTAKGGEALFLFTFEEGVEGVEEKMGPKIGTLVPAMICGLLR